MALAALVFGAWATPARAQQIAPMPAIVHHAPLHAGFELRGGIGTALFARSDRYDFTLSDPSGRSGTIVSPDTRVGPALVLHGGGGLVSDGGLSFGLEYRWLLASMGRTVGPIDRFGASLERRVTLQGVAAYVQASKGTWVFGGSFGVVSLHEATARGGPLFFSGESGEYGTLVRGRTVPTYTLGGFAGYRSLAGAFPKAFGWHAGANLEIVGLEPLEPIRVVLPGLYGRQFLSDFLEGLVLGVEVGLDFN